VIVILEGPDGAGKTTLARYLCEKYCLEYRHTDKPGTEDLFRAYQRSLHGAKHVLFDRLFHGELVYGPLMRGTSRLTATQAFYLELEAADALVIWCHAPPEQLKARGDPIYNTVSPEQLLNRYAYVRESSRLAYQIYDSSIQLPPDVTLGFQPGLCPPGRWVGGRSPKFLLVGERFPGQLPHHSSERWRTEPLVSWRPFDNSRSGEYLLKALILCGAIPSQVRITNAFKDHLPLHESRAVLAAEAAGCKVIALGNDAEAELRRAGVTVDEKLPHPQWWSRFRHDQLNQYAEVLGAALK
jgi:hypothetical protein